MPVEPVAEGSKAMAKEPSSIVARSGSFRPCAVIPTYNNPDTILRVVASIQAHVPDVFVVDDGGDDVARRALAEVERRPGVVVHHRSSNGGKGAAVKDGLSLAASAGFTHALQVDADGQHDLQDVPRFLQQARANPAHLVLGHPVFDDTVPKTRLRARQITVFWVSIETAGRSIVDPMCGFRVYPIAPAMRAGTRGNFMDFDPEIAVRMVWGGAPVTNLATRVRYLGTEEGGVSHFHMLWDNVRISWMHTRLCCEAVFRVPLMWLRSLGARRDP